MTWFTKAPDADAGVLGQYRYRYLQAMVLIFLAASSIAVVGMVLLNAALENSLILFGFTLAAFFMNLSAYTLLRHGYVTLVTFIIIAQALLGMFATLNVDFWWLMFNSVLAIVTAATLAKQNLYRAVMLVVLATVIFMIVRTMQLNNDFNAAVPYLVVLVTLLIISATTRYFTEQAVKAAAVAANSANLLQAAAATGEIIGKLLKVDELLPQAVDLIRDRFAFYHVQIFLLDEAGENAQLAASTGEVGQMLFARRHSLPVGSRSVIGRVTSSGQPVLANDTDSFHHRNELLPNTRSELALPILDGDKIIGALDVQSRRYEVFTTEVIQALQVLANQLGITIRNARLFEEQEKTTYEARRLFLESETNLREIQRLNQQLTRTGWQDYMQTRKSVSGVTLSENTISSEAEWTESLLEASQTRESVTNARDGQQVIAVPMMLGSEVIGAIEVEAGDNMQEADITEMVNAVAQRLALTLDKARLFEESQEATAREQRINEIVTRYQSVNNVDELLRITLQELSESLGATYSSIRLGAAPVTASPNGESHA